MKYLAGGVMEGCVRVLMLIVPVMLDDISNLKFVLKECDSSNLIISISNLYFESLNERLKLFSNVDCRRGVKFGLVVNQNADQTNPVTTHRQMQGRLLVS